MKLSIMQPAYLPWLGYFDRVAASDMHVILDHVTLDHSSKTKFANRNRIRTPQGWCWLSVPLAGETVNEPIRDVRVAPGNSWAKKHWSIIRHNYARSPYFSEHALFFEAFFSGPFELLTEATDRSTDYLFRSLGIDTPIVRSSDLGIESTGSQLILDICTAMETDTYISGPFGRTYLDEDSFRAAGVELVYHSYVCPEYRQAFPGFEPYMSIIDLMFNCGNDVMDLVGSGSVFENVQ